ILRVLRMEQSRVEEDLQVFLAGSSPPIARYKFRLINSRMIKLAKQWNDAEMDVEPIENLRGQAYNLVQVGRRKVPKRRLQLDTSQENDPHSEEIIEEIVVADSIE
ncbi:unnamed protein product, partial [Allacma fusca]